MIRLLIAAAMTLALTSCEPAFATSNNFLEGVVSINVVMHKEKPHHRMCPRNWWIDQGEPVMVPCKTTKAINHKSRVVVGPVWGRGIVSTAQAYIGTNPTGWRRVWCGRFIAMISPSVAAKVSNPNMAKSYLSLPKTNGNVGDLAVMGRRGGGHIGVVSGFDAKGNPIIVSGNAGGGIVREGAYDRRRVIAFVSPD